MVSTSNPPPQQQQPPHGWWAYTHSSTHQIAPAHWSWQHAPGVAPHEPNAFVGDDDTLGGEDEDCFELQLTDEWAARFAAMELRREQRASQPSLFVHALLPMR